VSSSLPAVSTRRAISRATAHAVGYEGRRTTTLIDTRLVRAELARLRAPRPATTVYRARAIHSTISGEA
jgi:hypothetical protein